MKIIQFIMILIFIKLYEFKNNFIVENFGGVFGVFDMDTEIKTCHKGHATESSFYS